MTLSNAEGARRAARRLAIVAVALALSSAVLFYADETAWSYRQLDGYLTLLPIVRLGMTLVIAGLLFAATYPASVLCIAGPLALDEWRRPDAHRAQPFPRGVRRLVDLVLLVVVVAAAYKLVRPALDTAILPLEGVSALPERLRTACLVAMALLAAAAAVQAAFLAPRVLRALRARSAARALPARAPTSVPFCPRCGTPSVPGETFCRECGAGLDRESS